MKGCRANFAIIEGSNRAVIFVAFYAELGLKKSTKLILGEITTAFTAMLVKVLGTFHYLEINVEIMIYLKSFVMVVWVIW